MSLPDENRSLFSLCRLNDSIAQGSPLVSRRIRANDNDLQRRHHWHR
jgi:hypothetical protein